MSDNCCLRLHVQSLTAHGTPRKAPTTRSSSIFLRRIIDINVYAGKLEVRPPGAPTSTPSDSTGFVSGLTRQQRGGGLSGRRSRRFVAGPQLRDPPSSSARVDEGAPPTTG